MTGKKDKKEIHTEGGAYIGGNVNTGGDFVGRDKKVSAGERGVVIGGNVSGSTIVTGDHNIVGGAVNLSQVFAPVYEAIQRSPRPAQDREDLTAEVREIEAAAVQPQVDEPWLARRLRNLKKMAPDIAEVALAALSGPGAVVSSAVKKIAARVKGEGA
ncbi:MAG: hypothetical protein Kow0070_31560 [Anaerolineales bacterium]